MIARVVIADGVGAGVGGEADGLNVAVITSPASPGFVSCRRTSDELSDCWVGDRFLTKKVSRPSPSSQSQPRLGLPRAETSESNFISHIILLCNSGLCSAGEDGS